MSLMYSCTAEPSETVISSCCDQGVNPWLIIIVMQFKVISEAKLVCVKTTISSTFQPPFGLKNTGWCFVVSHSLPTQCPQAWLQLTFFVLEFVCACMTLKMIFLNLGLKHDFKCWPGYVHHFDSFALQNKNYAPCLTNNWVLDLNHQVLGYLLQWVTFVAFQWHIPVFQLLFLLLF